MRSLGRNVTREPSNYNEVKSFHNYAFRKRQYDDKLLKLNCIRLVETQIFVRGCQSKRSR